MRGIKGPHPTIQPHCIAGSLEFIKETEEEGLMFQIVADIQ